jgi:hypothetical protein
MLNGLWCIERTTLTRNDKVAHKRAYVTHNVARRWVYNICHAVDREAITIELRCKRLGAILPHTIIATAHSYAATINKVALKHNTLGLRSI